VVVSFPDRITGAGLYAFVEADANLGEDRLRHFLLEKVGKLDAPRFIQRAEQLPRDASGTIRKDLLQLIASNQIELLAGLIRSTTEQRLVDQLVASRCNLHDRFVL
jgi:acyl-coenzyme A synthetase/AMP-(fatty) acid ligase